MGSQGVRAAIAAHLAPPAIPGLSTVYRGLPVTIVDTDWAIGIDTGWGAGSYLHINDRAESRVAMGGEHGGIKRVDYQCALVVFFRWRYTDHGPDNATDGWTDAFDGLIDDLVTRIRADRTFGCGTSGPIWQVGEGEQDVRVQVDAPHEDSGQVVVWAALEFEVTEMVTT